MTGTTLLPPDWSQFLPDLIVAVATGVAVGIAILIVERAVDRRKKQVELLAQQSAVVSSALILLNRPFQYGDGSMAPREAGLVAIEEAIDRVEYVDLADDPGFAFLVMIMSSWLAVKTEAAAIDEWLFRNASHFPEMREDVETLLAESVSLSIGANAVAFDVEAVPARTKNVIDQNEGLLAGVAGYVQARVELEATRNAFFAAVDSYRSIPRALRRDQRMGATANSVRRRSRQMHSRRNQKARRAAAMQMGYAVLRRHT